MKISKKTFVAVKKMLAVFEEDKKRKEQK